MDTDDLKEAMAAASKAFAEGLAANAEAKQEKDEVRAVAELRGAALRHAKDYLGRQRRFNRDRVVMTVARYCSQTLSDVLDGLKNDKRMPRSINYLERYNALLGMDDRFEVLRRLDQTIARAEAILDEADEIDGSSVDAALSEAAAEYAKALRGLGGITVAAAEEVVGDETGMPTKTPVFKKAESDEEFEKTIEDAFIQAFGAVAEDEEVQTAAAADRDARIEKLLLQVEEATLAAEKASKAALHSAAESVVGNVLSIPERPAFDGSVALVAEVDAGQVRELCVEVRKSFKTFKQVVKDNGLFAAFASEGTFGACSGWRFGYWWDDFFYDESEFGGEVLGRGSMRDIPIDIEEDEGGDSLEKSVERMRGFNEKKYWGMLDDDFDDHIEAFWYGFKKLMENVNGLYRMNSSTFNEYCNGLADDVKQATLDVGAASMDAHQVDEFCKAIEEKKQ